MIRYAALLAEHQPKAVRSEREYRRMLSIAESLTRPNASKAEIQLLDLVGDLIEKYEAEQFPIPAAEPGQVLEHLIASREISRSEFAREVGVSRQLVTDIIKGRSGIKLEQMRKFAAFFGVQPAVFVPRS